MVSCHHRNVSVRLRSVTAALLLVKKAPIGCKGNVNKHLHIDILRCSSSLWIYISGIFVWHGEQVIGQVCYSQNLGKILSGLSCTVWQENNLKIQLKYENTAENQLTTLSRRLWNGKLSIVTVFFLQKIYCQTVRTERLHFALRSLKAKPNPTALNLSSYCLPPADSPPAPHCWFHFFHLSPSHKAPREDIIWSDERRGTCASLQKWMSVLVVLFLGFMLRRDSFGAVGFGELFCSLSARLSQYQRCSVPVLTSWL